MRSGIHTNLLDVQEDARHLRFEPSAAIREVNVQRAIETAVAIASETSMRVAAVVNMVNTPFTPASDVDILLVQLSPAIVNLPQSSTRNGKPLIIKDLTASATVDITINKDAADPFGMDGLASLQILTAMAGYRLTPIAGGWIITP